MDREERSGGSVHVRAARETDHPQVLAVANEWWGGREVSSLAQRLFFEHFADTSLIAEDEAGLAGFLIGFLSQARPNDAYIHMVATRPERRRANLARNLYTRFFDVARAVGCDAVTCITAPENETSIAFHTRLGFSAILRPNHEGPGADKIVFRLSLNAESGAQSEVNRQ